MRKRKLFIAILLCLLVSMIAPVQADAAAAKVKLNKTKVSIKVGKTYKLAVKGTKKKVTWKSSNKKVATVSSRGKVTAKKAGTAKITAKVGNRKLKCTVTVQSVLSANKTSVELKPGETSKVSIKMKASGKVSYKIADKSIVSCSLGKRKKNTVPLTIKAKSSGTTTITIKNSYNKEKVKIRVTVSKPAVTEPTGGKEPEHPWDNVEVVIPKTLGEQDYPMNRMEILNYSFSSSSYSEADYYNMDITFKLVQYEKTLRTNWGEDFICYDKNGKELKKCFMYAIPLELNRIYTEDAHIPMDTAKIVFMEYPEK